MKKAGVIGILGYDGTIPCSYKLTLKERLDRSGSNYGNLLFMYSIRKLLTELNIDSFYVTPENTNDWTNLSVLDECKSLIIPASNFITAEYDLAKLYEFLNKIDINLIVVGLGTQIAPCDNLTEKISPSNLQVLKLLSERCRSIGVRGSVTQAVLRAIGIENTTIMGCPSNFIRRNDIAFESTIRTRYEQLSSKQSLRIIANGDEPYSSEYISSLEGRLYSWSDISNGCYVIQSCEPLLQILDGNNNCENNYLFMSDARKIYEPHSPRSLFVERFRRNARTYISIEQWMHDAGGYDMSIGRRFHGNMAAFQAGCPSVWIAHDVRTSELIDELSLPRIRISDVLNSDSPLDMLSLISINLDSYFERREHFYSVFEKLVLDSI